MNVSALVIDFSRVLIFARADVPSLNRHHDDLAAQPGYRVLEHFYLNDELLAYLRAFGAKWPVILFTDGRLHTLPEIAPKLQGIFQQTVSANELGYKKFDPQAYLALSYRVGRTPDQMLFVDDQPRNIAAAKEAGYATHRFVDTAELMMFLDTATSPSK